MTTTAVSTPVTRTERAVNAVIRWLADRGVNLAGARTLTVRGRRTGAAHRIPVNPLLHDVTDWVRNVRVAPQAELRRGRRTEAVELVEVTDPDLKVAVQSRYLAKWGWEVGRLLPGGLTPDADEATLKANTDLLPVFEVRAH